MNMTRASLVCLCVFGAAHLGLSQVKAPAASAIPGYLDPATGKFTTQTASATTTQPNAQGIAALTGTSIFFREDFQISVQNFDQPSNATAVCSVDIATYDANGSFSELASVPAIASGGGWSCDVPILTLWTLQNPNSDTITANVTIYLYTQTTPVPLYRSSSQTYTLAIPTNGQTIVTTPKFQL